MTDQTKQKIEELVEKEEPHDDCTLAGCTVDGKYHKLYDEESLRRAITFGLELAKEAGPEKTGKVRWFNEVLNEVWDAALTAKNAAIQELIDEVKTQEEIG